MALSRDERLARMNKLENPQTNSDSENLVDEIANKNSSTPDINPADSTVEKEVKEPAKEVPATTIKENSGKVIFNRKNSRVKKRTSICLDEELFDIVTQISQDNNISFSEVISETIRQTLM